MYMYCLLIARCLSVQSDLLDSLKSRFIRHSYAVPRSPKTHPNNKGYHNNNKSNSQSQDKKKPRIPTTTTTTIPPPPHLRILNPPLATPSPSLFPTLTPPSPPPVTFAPAPFVQLSTPHSKSPGQQPPPTSLAQLCHPLAQFPVSNSGPAGVGATIVTPLPLLAATVVDPEVGQSVRPQSRPTRQQPPW